MISPNPNETARKDQVLTLILSDIRENRVIKLPDFDRTRVQFEPPFALAALGETDSPYTGTVGPFRYHFEGEEDLLHLFVIRKNADALTVEEAQEVAAFLYAEVPKALIWLKPGTYSQHFYIGHDELLRYLKSQ